MSKSAPYFPFYVDDWLDDENIFNMGLECEGAYIRLLSAMWKRNGYIPDNQNWCCNLLRCKPAKWRKIRAILVDEMNIILTENDRLFNQRLMEELLFFNEKYKKNSQNANKRWSNKVKKDTKKPNKINESTHANASQSQCHTDTDTDTDTDIEIKEKEKEKEKPKKTAIHFEEFWQSYPKKAGKQDCLKKWKLKNLDGIAKLIISDVICRKKDHKQWQDGYIPNPLTYLNGQRWEDEIVTRDINPKKDCCSIDELFEPDFYEKHPELSDCDFDHNHGELKIINGTRLKR
jgi:uncharacterized protein YdaU (DUF1376 family)